MFSATGAPLHLGTVSVLDDGTFEAALPIPASLPPGDYTLQVNGLDLSGTLRTVSVGVRVEEPLADLILTAVPNDPTPMVGDTVTITITVTNAGLGTALDVVIPRAFREPGFEVLGATPLHGTYDRAAETWTIPRIEAGARAQLLLTVLVLPPGASSNAQTGTVTGIVTETVTRIHP